MQHRGTHYLKIVWYDAEDQSQNSRRKEWLIVKKMDVVGCQPMTYQSWTPTRLLHVLITDGSDGLWKAALTIWAFKNCSTMVQFLEQHWKWIENSNIIKHIYKILIWTMCKNIKSLGKYINTFFLRILNLLARNF